MIRHVGSRASSLIIGILYLHALLPSEEAYGHWYGKGQRDLKNS